MNNGRESVGWRCAAFLVGALLISGCALPLNGGAKAKENAGSIPNTTATPDSEVYTYPTRACPVQQWDTIVSQPEQTHLIAWDPSGDRLAFVGKDSNGGWLYMGDLYLASAPQFDEPADLVKDMQVSGDLTWSPDGERLAFTLLRQTDKVYSVAWTDSAGSGPSDLFPAEKAQTDPWASEKTILGWESDARIRVSASCGLDCSQELLVDLPGGAITPDGDPTRKLVPWYWKWIYAPPTPPIPLPENRYWNASPDGQQIAYYDVNGRLWVFLSDVSARYPIDLGGEKAFEVQWSMDGAYLAIRTDQAIHVDRVNCEP